MKGFLVGFAVMTGPTIAWHMRDVARRTPDHPSRSEPPPGPGLDGPIPAAREDHRP